MKYFVINTRSESGDDFTYIIKHDNKPSHEELKAFLIKNSCDKDENEHVLYEYVETVVEIDIKEALTIPKMSSTALEKWDSP
jgi:hypothetical protein